MSACLIYFEVNRNNSLNSTKECSKVRCSAILDLANLILLLVNNMNNYNKTKDTEDLQCPLCQCDEYLISSDGEKFTCASCGFHTKNFSSIQCLHQTPYLQT